MTRRDSRRHSPRARCGPARRAAAAALLALCAAPLSVAEARIQLHNAEAEAGAGALYRALEDGRPIGQDGDAVAALAAAEPDLADAVAAFAEPALAEAHAPRSRGAAVLRRVLSGAVGGPPSLSAQAQALAADPLVSDLLEWRRLSQDRSPSFQAVAAFLDRRPGWPRAGRMRARAELGAPGDAPPAETIAYFEQFEPRTLRGARLYGEALIGTGSREAGEDWLVRGWRDLAGPPAEESRMLRSHGALVAPHHEARLNQLILRKRYRGATRLAKAIGAQDMAALTEARVALLRGSRGVDRLIAAVPAHLQSHPGLAHARVAWREERGRRAEAEAVMREATVRRQLGEPELWAALRMRFARDAFEEGRYDDAFTLADGHGLASGGAFADLQWFAGWMALTKLGAPQVALERFEGLWDAVTTPISLSRAAYWAGEAAAAADEPERARLWRERAAAYPGQFYGQLAAEALGGVMPSGGPPAATRTAGGGLAGQTFQDAAALLYQAGYAADGRAFLLALADQADDAAALGPVAAFARAQGDTRGEISVASRAGRRGVVLWEALYPIPATPNFRAQAAEPALLLGVARQESRFDASAKSHAGALGLMQLMPATARMTARRLGVSHSRSALTQTPAYNLTLGASHMALLLDYYEGSYILAIAAYNAGEGNVNRWVRRFGDPRLPGTDILTWLESIPFRETRNYVQRVLEATQVYRARLAGRDAPIRITHDLTRGGPAPWEQGSP